MFKNLLSLFYIYTLLVELLNKEAVVALLSSYPNRPTGVVDGCIMVAIGRECHCFSMVMSDNTQIVNKMFIENYFFLFSSIHAKLRLLDCNITLYSMFAGKSTPKYNFFQSFLLFLRLFISIDSRVPIIREKTAKSSFFFFVSICFYLAFYKLLF